LLADTDCLLMRAAAPARVDDVGCLPSGLSPGSLNPLECGKR
jgi:hypothetical protein